MPTQTFTSFEAYANAVQSANLRAIFRGPKRANWVLSYLTFKNLGVQWAQAGGPAMMEGTVTPGGLGIVMPYRNAHALSMNGRRFDDFSLMVLRPGDEFCSSAADCNSWFSIFVPDEMLADMSSSAMAAIRPVRVGMHSPSSRFRQFRSTVQQLGFAVQRTPAAFHSAAAVKAAEHKLLREIRQAFVVQHEVTQTPDRH